MTKQQNHLKHTMRIMVSSFVWQAGIGKCGWIGRRSRRSWSLHQIANFESNYINHDYDNDYYYHDCYLDVDVDIAVSVTDAIERV